MSRIKRPFTVTACSLLAAYTVLMTVSDTFTFLIIITLAVLCALFAVLRRRISVILLITLCCFMCASLLFTYMNGLAEFTAEASGYYVKIEGTVMTYPESTDSDTSYFVLSDTSANGTELYGKIKVYCDTNESLTPGDRVCFTARTLSSQRADGIFRYHSLSDGIYLTAYTYDPVEITKEHSDKNIYTKILRLKKQISDKLSENLTSEHSAITNALLTGDKSGLSEETQHSFKVSGASHIFAVSGMHLSIWTGIFFLLFRKKATVSVIPNLAAIVFTVFYCIFTGFSPSVLRAGIMLITVFISRIIKRHSDMLNTWGIAGTLLTLQNPFLAGNVSFLLSYWATFALFFFNAYVFSPTAKTKNILIDKSRKLKSSFLISSGVTAVTLPVSSVFMGYISLLSPISSLIITPVAEAIMITSGIASFVSPRGVTAELLFPVISFLNELLINILHFLESLDFTVIPADSSFVLPCFILTAYTVMLLIVTKHSRKDILTCILTGAVLLTSVFVINTNIHSDEIKIYIPSNENATAVTITNNNAAAFLYGSGGSFDCAENTVRRLSENGILSVDKLYIPRFKASENNNTDYLQSRLLPENTVNLYKTGSRYIFSEDIWKNVSIYSDISDSFAASVLYINGIKLVICTLPSSDFSEDRQVFTSGDILLCRSKLPDTLSIENFKNVIVMTDKNTYDSDDRIISSRDKDTVITIKGASYAVN